MAAPHRWARLRWTGLAGTALMATGAFGAGALPGSDPRASLQMGGWTPSWDYGAGLVTWLAGLVLLAWAWWRIGAAVRGDSHAVPVRWLLVTGALWALPLLVAPPIASRDVYVYACQGAIWLDGADPYATGVRDGGCPWIDAAPPPWRDTPTPYGPLAVALSGGVVALARSLSATEHGQLLIAVGLFRVVALAGALLLAGALPRLARAAGVDPVVAVWLGLVSPLAAIHVASGAHNDAVMVGFVAAALALAAMPPSGRAAMPPSGRAPLPAAALVGGALLGLAAAIKATAVVAVPFVVVLAVERARRDGRGLRRWPGVPRGPEAPGGPGVRAAPLVRSALAVGAGGAVVFAGLTAAAGVDLGWVGALSDTGRLVQWLSLPSGLGMAAGYLLRLAGRPEAVGPAVAVARVLGLGVLAAVAAGLVVAAARRAAGAAPRARADVVVLCGAAFAAAAVLSPVFYPWYGLVALIVLAAGVADQRWRSRLAAAGLVLCFLVLPDGLGMAVLTKAPGAVLDVVVAAALVVAGVRWLVRWRTARAGRTARSPAPPAPPAPPPDPPSARPAAQRPDRRRR